MGTREHFKKMLKDEKKFSKLKFFHIPKNSDDLGTMSAKALSYDSWRDCQSKTGKFSGSKSIRTRRAKYRKNELI